MRRPVRLTIGMLIGLAVVVGDVLLLGMGEVAMALLGLVVLFPFGMEIGSWMMEGWERKHELGRRRPLGAQPPAATPSDGT